MLEKITKYFSSKATDGAVEGVKTTINEKFDQYGDIIRIGLAVAVVVIGARHITRPNNGYYVQPVDSLKLPSSGQSPIVINNYYPGYQSVKNERRMRNCEQRSVFSQQARQMGSQYQKRR